MLSSNFLLCPCGFRQVVFCSSLPQGCCLFGSGPPCVFRVCTWHSLGLIGCVSGILWASPGWYLAPSRSREWFNQRGAARAKPGKTSVKNETSAQNAIPCFTSVCPAAIRYSRCTSHQRRTRHTCEAGLSTTCPLTQILAQVEHANVPNQKDHRKHRRT